MVIAAGYARIPCGRFTLRAIATRATDLGLFLRPDRYSLMVSPPQDKRVILFTVWPQCLEGESFRIWRSARAFADYIPGVAEDAARAAPGDDNEGTLPRAGVDGLLDRLSDLLANSGLAVTPTDATVRMDVLGTGPQGGVLGDPPRARNSVVGVALTTGISSAAAASTADQFDGCGRRGR